MCEFFFIFAAAKVQLFFDMTKIELLAPARDLTVGRAAIDSGADAVYIGAPRFGARQAAGNSIADIAALCDYAHLFDVRVWVTRNTLLTDEELPAAVALAWQLYEVGVDGLIIQDLRLLNENLPPLRLHASTQCDNRSLERVKEIESLGFQRVVLARELSLEEIRTIREHTQIELEAFVHGALCVSYSGACYLSEHVCGRSANRGACAQMCRQRYDVLNKDGNILLHDQYILSLHDMDRSQSLRALLDAGVVSLKIEGRLKDEHYVRNIVAYYRQQLDAIFAASEGQYERASKGVVTHAFVPNPAKTFHRGGIDYFLYGRTSHMANWNTPKSTGEYIGRVLPGKGLRIDLAPGIELHNGDGLTYGDQGFYWPNPTLQIPAGTPIYRNYDKAFMDALEAPNACVRKIPVRIVFAETEEGFALTIGNASRTFTYEKQPARNAERAEQTVREQLSKLGDSVYIAEDIVIDWSQPYFLPISVLNQWRRDCVQQLVALLIPPTAKSTGEQVPPLSPKNTSFSGGPKENKPLMTCRYCILHEMNLCRKESEYVSDKSVSGEPAYIRTGGKTFRLVFDCKNCQMLVTE